LARDGMEASKRRLSVLSGHLAPGGEVELATISRSPASAPSTSGSGGSGSAYASATGAPTSYARVHGEPSRAPAQWRLIRSVAREELQDVLYHKAEGEGIAKVRADGSGAVAVAAAARRRAGGREGAAAPALRAGQRRVKHCPARRRAQITINRPDKRNAFRPRTGGRRRPGRPRPCWVMAAQRAACPPLAARAPHPPILSTPHRRPPKT
jgi:hypothetical protein